MTVVLCFLSVGAALRRQVRGAAWPRGSLLHSESASFRERPVLQQTQLRPAHCGQGTRHVQNQPGAGPLLGTLLQSRRHVSVLAALATLQ